MLQNLVLKATYLHYFVVMEYIIVLLVDPGQNHVFVLLLVAKLETLTPFWSISNVPAHPIFAHVWEIFIIIKHGFSNVSS